VCGLIYVKVNKGDRNWLLHFLAHNAVIVARVGAFDKSLVISGAFW
jgi:hypothetical protein